MEDLEKKVQAIDMLNEVNDGSNGPNSFGSVATDGQDPNVETTDADLTLGEMFMQSRMPSLPRMVCAVQKMDGPTGAAFCMRTKVDEEGNDISELEVVRMNMVCLPSVPIKTNVTDEALDDMVKQFGVNSKFEVCKMLRSSANSQENKNFLKFLQDNCVDRGHVIMQETINLEVNFFNVHDKVTKCIREANKRYNRTMEAFAVIPYTIASGISGLGIFQDFTVESRKYTNFIGRIGFTNYFVNPNQKDETCYVGLYDKHVKPLCGVYMAEYICNLMMAKDANTGQNTYFIFDRYGFAPNPFHTTDDPMLFKFGVEYAQEFNDGSFGKGITPKPVGTGKDIKSNNAWYDLNGNSGETSEAGAGEGSTEGDGADLDVDGDDAYEDDI